MSADFLAAAVAPFGLNLIGVASVASYDAGVPPERGLACRLPGAACEPLARRMSVRVLYPFGITEDGVSFTRLALLAGLGRPSLVGVLVHPVYGPWIALRAAILVPERLAASRPADGFDPCPSCRERPCIGACPGGAVGAAGWSVPACGGYRARPDDPCATRCHARVACVLGPEHRYPDDALAYHQRRAREPLLRFSRS